MREIIEVNQLSKAYGSLNAVRDLSFAVREAEIYGFLGQNGAGKSTTIRMLLSLIKPDSGSIRLFGMDLRKHRKEILFQTGALIERPDAYKFMSAYDNLRIFAHMSGLWPGRQELLDQLDLVGLKDRADSRVSGFSQGMKQRLGIAIALVHKPRLVILDEPVNGLDPQGIADIRRLILRLSREEGKTILLSSHLLSEVQLLADRMLIMHKGRKMIEGSVQDLLDPGKTQLELEVTEPGPVYEKLVNSTWEPFLGESKEGIIHMHLHKDQIPALNQYLVQEAGACVLRIQPRHSLEDYFLSLTNAENHAGAFAN